MSDTYEAVIEQRRSYYSIAKQATISDDEIKKLIAHAVKYTPSPYNSQSQRVVLLLRGEHDVFWELVASELQTRVPADTFEQTREKIDGFKNGYGTVLYFVDTAVTGDLVKKMPLFKEQFTVWAQHANAMLQFAVWNMLEEKGMGASLQHYNPLVDDAVKQTWRIDPAWALVAQMPFGKPSAQPEEKEFRSVEERFLVFE